MALSATHDKINLVATGIAMGIAVYYRYPSDVVLMLGVATVFGGVYFSPDIDTFSVPYKRWGYFRWWWKGYQKWLGHRGYGHLPILGTVSRLMWTIPFWLPLVYYFRPPKNYLIVLLLGLEISSLVHWFTDIMSFRKADNVKRR